MAGSAIIHINGVQYMLSDRYKNEKSPEYLNLTSRIERMLGNEDTQIEHFEVLIQGQNAHLMVRPSQLVSAAILFVPM
jgi:hypothetical protein